MKCKVFTVSRAMHAPLLARYDIGSSRHVKLGRGGRFGPEDDDGNEFKVLGTPSTTQPGMVTFSSDCKAGLFYPANVFVWGEDENGKPLPYEEVEEFAKKLRHSKFQRVKLPKGYEGRKMTWDHAVMYTPVEMQPIWSHVPDDLRRIFPQADVDDSARSFIQIYFDGPETTETAQKAVGVDHE